MVSKVIDCYKDDTLNSNPLTEITNKELDLIILRMGAFLSIISNKKNNQAKLLITSVKDKYFKELFLKQASIDNVQLLVRCIIERYPTVCKSKVVINSFVNQKL